MMLNGGGWKRPSFQYQSRVTFTAASSSNLGTQNIGTADLKRQVMVFTAGNWFPQGTVNRSFTTGSVNSIYQFGGNLSNGTFLSTAFASYVDRDSMMVSDYVTSGTTSNITLTHSIDGASQSGYCWIVSVYDLVNKTPQSTTYTTTNSPSVNVPAGAMLVVLLGGNSSGTTFNTGTKYGDTTPLLSSYYYSLYIYQNTSQVTESKTLTWSVATLGRMSYALLY